MAKKSPGRKPSIQTRAAAAKKRGAGRKKSGGTAATRLSSKTKSASSASLAKAKALEKLDAAKPKSPKRTKASQLTASGQHSLRNTGFPQTYIAQIDVRLDDPNHSMTLTWTGPQAAGQETGPFHTSPGAGAKGLNCDDTATSVRSGTKCTPKGTRTVEGFQQRLNSDSRATFVTWFMQSRGIALHYFPSVPTYAASHGCVRVESQHVAQLIQDNSRVGVTKVVVGGTWTKPAKQW